MRLVVLSSMVLMLCVNAAALAADNSLTEKEREQGWRLLFNGKDLTGWQCNNGRPIATKIEDGSLVPYKSGGYLIIHEKAFGDFVLKCDVRWEDPRCNSGIFFRVENPNDPVNTGFEVQIMSGEGTGKHDLGAIYDLVGTTRNAGKPTGEWNSVEIRCKGPHIAVTVNGEQVSKINCDDFDRPGLCPDGEGHKYRLNGQPRAIKDFARRGFLGFQDHGHKVWYKNVKLLELSE